VSPPNKFMIQNYLNMHFYTIYHPVVNLSLRTQSFF